jgi:hypothetical protein
MVKQSLMLLLILALSGCAGGAVVFVPTPLPPDVSPTLYTHPSGAFSLVIPRNWSHYVQPSDQVAAASFSPPDERQPLVRVAVVNTGSPISDTAFGSLMLQYQTLIRPDIDYYTEQDRQAMSDGSWRVTGVRSFHGTPQPLNTFLQKQGSLFAVLEVALPRDPTLTTDVQTFINTFTLHEENTLPPAQLSALATTSSADLEVSRVKAWVGSGGVFFITGEVSNRSLSPFYEVPVEARLLDADGQIVTLATDTLKGHGILPGGFAPFSLRFGGGQPPEAVTFELTVGRPDEPLTIQPHLSSPALRWTDRQEIGTQGQFYIVGTVTNESGAPIRQVEIIATVFDEAGDVIGVGFTEAADELRPGDTVEWTLLVPELGGEPRQYVVNAQGLP